MPLSRYGNKESEPTPGPGEYQPNSSSVFKRTPMVKMSHQKRDDGLLSGSVNNPGPGSYDLFCLRTGPKFPFGTGKRNRFRTDAGPGPGCYNLPHYIGKKL